MNSQFRRSGRFLRIVVLVVMAGILVIPATAVAAPKPAGSCENVTGTFEVFAIPIFDGGNLVGFEVVATDSTGPLAGNASASVVVDSITPGGTIHLSGVHTFTDTSFGTFKTSDKITIAPNGRVHNMLTIVEGASGSFHSHGEANLETGALQLRYHGRVCHA